MPRLCSSLVVGSCRVLCRNNLRASWTGFCQYSSLVDTSCLPRELLTFAVELRHLEKHRRKLTGSPRAAVLVPFCLYQDQLSLLFTWRSLLVGSHKGQVSFPGGKLDVLDRGDAIRASLRETHEEIGISPGTVVTLGLFDDYRSINGYNVTPVIGFLGPVERQKLRVNEREVQEVFMLSLVHLLQESNMRVEHTSRGDMPIYNGGPVEIWGLTAFILRDILKIFPK
ncbi:Nucleoside diphosphate-linked moiety X motif 8, mitochondrial [Galdieria sulphuraria]|uniref:Hydrolase n=1 Tax=Galdieria sulphuraria TaxID=130081 RepID=M2Y5L9_GALSU|nr:hydrolase [Galdieria sulphuraria]EME31258.1 hydrolase [Galdieria sulphuraria]GJD07679.1 Nucleoside diphosphate-linked moiety X motif 8, mitochondrial [Galdieria sulphuraria]|eukprot:XP_005707778.1 hydrolase [Galdieria sulphuraria]